MHIEQLETRILVTDARDRLRRVRAPESSSPAIGTRWGADDAGRAGLVAAAQARLRAKLSYTNPASRSRRRCSRSRSCASCTWPRSATTCRRRTCSGCCSAEARSSASTAIAPGPNGRPPSGALPLRVAAARDHGRVRGAQAAARWQDVRPAAEEELDGFRRRAATPPAAAAPRRSPIGGGHPVALPTTASRAHARRRARTPGAAGYASSAQATAAVPERIDAPAGVRLVAGGVAGRRRRHPPPALEPAGREARRDACHRITARIHAKARGRDPPAASSRRAQLCYPLGATAASASACGPPADQPTIPNARCRAPPRSNPPMRATMQSAAQARSGRRR